MHSIHLSHLINMKNTVFFALRGIGIVVLSRTGTIPTEMNHKKTGRDANTRNVTALRNVIPVPIVNGTETDTSPNRAGRLLAG